MNSFVSKFSFDIDSVDLSQFEGYGLDVVRNLLVRLSDVGFYDFKVRPHFSETYLFELECYTPDYLFIKRTIAYDDANFFPLIRVTYFIPDLYSENY